MLAKKLQVCTVAIAQVQFPQRGRLSITAEVAGKVRNRAGPMLSAESGRANVVNGLDLQPALRPICLSAMTKPSAKVEEGR